MDFITRLTKSRGILILGHRGCRGSNVFENTIPAFRRAFEAGADGIEIDVETALDGKLVVINRWFANKTFGFFPWERDLDTIRACAFKRGLMVPTFEDVCELIRSHRNSVFNVEVKSSDNLLCRTAKQVGRLINHYGIGYRVIVSSFDSNALFTLKRRYPAINTAYLFRERDRVADVTDKATLKYKLSGWINRSGIKAVITGADMLHPEIKLIDPDKLSFWWHYARRSARLVNCWTVNSREDFRKAVNIGAAMVISDNPGKTVAYRSEWAPLLSKR